MIFLYLELGRQSDSDRKSCPSSQDRNLFCRRDFEGEEQGETCNRLPLTAAFFGVARLLTRWVPFMSNNFISKLFTVCPKQLLLALSCLFPWQQSWSIQTPFKSCGKSHSQQCDGQNYREQAEYNPRLRRCIFFQGSFYFN